MIVKGFKVLNNEQMNNYGIKFEENNIYFVEGKVIFGINGNGIHFCENLEDVFRYSNAKEEEVKVALVIGFGDIATYHDEYYGYYDMHCASNLYVERILTREEIISHMLKLKTEHKIINFLVTFKLMKDEIELFKKTFEKNLTIMNAIAYYQEDKKDVYQKIKARY